MEKILHILEENTRPHDVLIRDHIDDIISNDIYLLLEHMTILRVWQITSRPALTIGTFARHFQFDK